MPGSLNELLPEPVSPESEKVILELLKRKVKSAASVGVMLLHAMEERFGAEAREVMKEMIEKRTFDPRPDPGDPQEDLQQFCADLDQACAGSHEKERVLDEPDRVQYSITRCLWAEIYNELGNVYTQLRKYRLAMSAYREAENLEKLDELAKILERQDQNQPLRTSMPASGAQ